MSSSTESSNVQSICWAQNGFFYKKSRAPNFVTENECECGEAINSAGLENFVKFISKIPTLDFGLQCFVSEWELLNDFSLSDAIQDSSISDDIVCGATAQVLLACLSASASIGFVHGDLHCGNVLLIPTDKTHISYSINEKKFLIETFGYIAKIIDFGHSKAWFLENQKMTTPFFNVKDGQCQIFFDPFYDLRYFLDAVTHEMFLNRTFPKQHLLKTLTFNLFSEFDEIESEDLFDILKKELEKVNGKCDFPSNLNMADVLEILLATVSVPLPETSVTRSHNAFKNHLASFFNAWSFFESKMSSEQAIIMLRNLVGWTNSSLKNTNVDGEEEFANFVTVQFNQIGNKHVDISTAARLFHALALVSIDITRFLDFNTFNLVAQLKGQNFETVFYLNTICQNFPESFASLVVRWLAF